jgi:uncharacterized membrane protein
MNKLSTKIVLNPLQLLKQGWTMTLANIKVFFPAVLLAFALVYGCHIQLIGYLSQQSPQATELDLILKSSAIIGLLFSPVEVAIMMLGVKVARNQPIQMVNLFDYLAKTPMIILVAIITTAAIQVGMILIIPGLFLIVSLSMAQLLLCDKNYSMIKALTESTRVVTKHWFSCFAVYLMLIGLILISFLTMGIALIITIPLYVCIKGLMYQKLFSTEDEFSLENRDDSEFEA